jgi:hypothetical protein
VIALAFLAVALPWLVWWALATPVEAMINQLWTVALALLWRVCWGPERKR